MQGDAPESVAERYVDGFMNGYAFAGTEPGRKPVESLRAVKKAMQIGAENKAFHGSVFPPVRKTAGRSGSLGLRGTHMNFISYKFKFRKIRENSIYSNVH